MLASSAAGRETLRQKTFVECRVHERCKNKRLLRQKFKTWLQEWNVGFCNQTFHFSQDGFEWLFNCSHRWGRVQTVRFLLPLKKVRMFQWVLCDKPIWIKEDLKRRRRIRENSESQIVQRITKGTKNMHSLLYPFSIQNKFCHFPHNLRHNVSSTHLHFLHLQLVASAILRNEQEFCTLPFWLSRLAGLT